MIQGVLLGFLSYGVFSCGDAAVKAAGGWLPIFEIGFFVSVFALLVLPFAKPAGERWRDTFRMRRRGLVLLRGLSGTMAGILGVLAFTTLPFAEAYALIFLAPLFTTLLSVLLLGERIGWRRVLAALVGFLGVMLVIRPGFRELLPGHFAAAGVALCTASTVLLLRVLGPTERRVTLLGVVIVMSAAVNGALMLLDFRMPMPAALAWTALAGILSSCALILLMAATRLAPANRVAPAQYSQIIWAVTLGAIFFGEFPDALALAGMALVALAGLFTFLREEAARANGLSAWSAIWTRPPRGGGPG